MSEIAADFTDDMFFGGRLRLRQFRKGHRAGHDAMLLAASVAARPHDRIVEFGTGTGAAGLAVASRVGPCDLTLIEIDAALAELARHNAAVNGIAVRVLALDVASPPGVLRKAGLAADSADAVLMNPPFNDAARHRASPDPVRRSAHIASEDGLASWVDAARRLLKSGGSLTLIWRADDLQNAIAALDKGFGSFAMVPIHGRADQPANRIVVRAVKGGRGPLLLHSALLLNDASGQPTAQAQHILSGGDVLPLAQPLRQA